FELQIKQKLDAGYLKDARVNVEVVNYRPFYIIGEVNKPGEYPYVNDMNLLNAIALAGGYTNRADDSDVYIRRNGSTKEVEFPADQTTKVMPGDIIRVSERFF
ncbi:MAG: SLBB domain-containing protein, partial [Proteobacteria bacterium]|nr:SLBB domain-containing protein [Pseudomonadota bacterium]